MPRPPDWKWTSTELEHRLMELEIKALRTAFGTRNSADGPKHMGRADAFREVRAIVTKGP